ncbi:MAG TPA: sulfite exporter TauE/SafE family protein [Gaiellaceae bacterium]
MFGLDDRIASLSDGSTLLLVVVVAIVLGLRHASDPDHLAAVSTLIATKRDRIARRAGALGFAWGLGHATSLFAFGVPIVLYRAYLPAAVQSAAETVVGLMIVALALWLLVRWRRGLFHFHQHEHDSERHAHAHAHPHAHPARARTPWQAAAIGVIHGMGGSAGVGILLLSAIPDHTLALSALALFALCTAVSMALLSTGFGLTLTSRPVRRSFHRVAPVLGVASLAFGLWYALGAQSLLPYYF